MPIVRFRINWKLTLFTVLFLPILISLGFWQLQRAHEKTTILENWASQQDSSPVSLADLSPDDIIGEAQVEFEGYFQVDTYWLQEGKTIRGKVGYLVLMLVVTPTGQNVLVNRGWIPADPDRSILPEVSTPVGLQAITGRIRKPSEYPMTEEATNPPASWPHRILEVETELMSRHIGKDLLPYIVDLSEDNPNTFTKMERSVNMPPEKHRGYAFQWFMMALTLVILWLLTNTNLPSLIGSNNNNKEEL